MNLNDNDNDKKTTTSLEDSGIFYFCGNVNKDLCAEAVEFILLKNLDRTHKFDYLNLLVNSPGGSVTDGFSVIDAMCGSKVNVHTTGIGMIASMGLLIFISGTKGKRVLTPNTLILSHQWSTFMWGKEHELISAQKEHKILSDMVIRHYKKHTGMSEKDIKKILLPPSDVWLTAKEAKQYGICDEVKDI